MININDNRKTNDRRLKDIEAGGFCMIDSGVLCRLVWDEGYIICLDGDDGVPIMQMTDGRLIVMNPDTWVEPIRDEQICMSVEDWG